MAPDWANPGDELLAEFTEETGISVIFNEVSWDDIRDKVSIAASGGEAAADVIEVDWSWVGEMNSAGWLEPIEMTDEDKEDMPTLETFTIDGEILAVPYANDYRIAYYNKEHFEQAGITEVPETWDEVYDALKKIKEAGIVEYPYTMPMNADESATTSMMWMAFSPRFTAAPSLRQWSAVPKRVAPGILSAMSRMLVAEWCGSAAATRRYDSSAAGSEFARRAAASARANASCRSCRFRSAHARLSKGWAPGGPSARVPIIS